MKSKGFDMEVELNHRVEREGFGIVEVPIQYRARLGEKKLGVRHGAEILMRMIVRNNILKVYAYQLISFFSSNR